MIERNIDCRKYRKSTHLASADLDALTLEKKELKFTITDVKYETGVDVNGKKQDAYFVKFKELEKEMILNSENRKTLSNIAGDLGFEKTDKYNISNWIGLNIELYVDRNVKMMGKIVDGIRIKPKPLKPITELEIIEIQLKVEQIKNKQELNSFYSKLLPKERINKQIIAILKKQQEKLKK